MSETPTRSSNRWLKRALTLLGAVLLIGVVGVACFWTELKTRYYISKLGHVDETELAELVDRLTEIGAPAVPHLVDCLCDPHPNRCEVAGLILRNILNSWEPGDPRGSGLAQQIHDVYAEMSIPGQRDALRLLTALRGIAPPDLGEVATQLARQALGHGEPLHRIEGIRLAMWPEVPLLPDVVPLMDDPDPAVRQAAMLALGPVRPDENEVEQSLVSSDQLLRWLHDPDPEVCRLCEMSLQSRGLREVEIRLGRRLTHPQPAERLRLLMELSGNPDLDLAAWLDRLSRDTSAAVRVGAARVAVERGVDLTSRLEQMSRSDPDPTVRRLATHYLQTHGGTSN